MARGKLFFIPGLVWHITQRCHNRQYLLRFKTYKKCWRFWLFQAVKKYGLKVIGYTITSNHIHLMVYSDGDRWTIPRSMQLVASCVAREYNLKKDRSGAFWEDNYHATAIEDDYHLHEGLVYIDLNPVRAGIVQHPNEWCFCGYYELMSNRERYRIINNHTLMTLLKFKDIKILKSSYKDWIESKISSGQMERESRWTESIAVGSEDFTHKIKSTLGIRVNYRKIENENKSFILKEK